jgi:hypothetical protein
MSYICGAPCKARNFNVVYIYMDLRLAMLRAVSFYLLHNVSTLNQCRKLFRSKVVFKHFTSYQAYPNYRWDLALSLLMAYIYIYISRTAQLTSRPCILNTYSTNICTEYFKNAT